MTDDPQAAALDGHATPPGSSCDPPYPAQMHAEPSVQTQGLACPKEKKHEVWPVILTWFIALSIGLAGTIALAMGVGIFHVVSGASADVLHDRLDRDPLLNLVMIVPMQAAFLLAPLFYTLVSSRNPTDLLGVGQPGHKPRHWPMFVFATPVPFMIGIVMSIPLPSLIDQEAMAALWAGMSPVMAVVWVLFLGLSPGFGEELLFRGLIQRRLLLRYRPVKAIGVSSVLFAISHMDPAQSAFALPLGVWFGVIAWRTGSIRLAIVAHILVNMTSSTMMILVNQQIVSAVLVSAVVIGLFLIGCVCFAGSLWVFCRPAAAKNPPIAG